MIFTVHGIDWKLSLEHPNSSMLMRSDNTYTLGVTDNNTKTVYVNERLSNDMFDKVLCHELVHVFSFSNNQMIDLTEEFIRTKMNRISSVINEKFKVVSFRLFETQINGGLKECCECMVNGVPYSSLNAGHRIVSGLDIISSISKLNKVSCPIFVDNAESINEFNIPDMESQMILLEVTDDKELKVEV